MPIKVEALDFPAAYAGQTLKLEVISADRYTLTNGEGELVLNGRVDADAPAAGKKLHFHVSEINAPVGSLFNIQPLSKDEMVEAVLKNLDLTKRNNNRNASILDFEFFWQDPYFALKLTDALIADYISRSMMRLNETKESALSELDTELSKLRVSLKQNEKKLSDYMSSLKVADVNAEMRGQLEMRLALEQDSRDIKMQKAQLKQIYTRNHPAMQALYEKEKELTRRMKTIDARLSELPEIKGNLFALNRMVEQQSREYELLMEQIANLKLETSTVINPASIINNPRIVRRNLRYKLVQVIVLGGMMGAIIAFCIIVLRLNLKAGSLQNLEQLGRYPALSLNDARKSKKPEVIEEIVSQLRYLSARRKHNLSIITGPVKSESSAKMLLEIAETYGAPGEKILVIDANLKHSHLAKRLGCAQKEGLANIMAGNAISEELIQRPGNTEFYYMPPGNPSMSLMILHDFERLDYIIKEMSALFSCIIIDLPSHQELPFWQSLLKKANLVIHITPLDQSLPSVKEYLTHTNDLAKQNGGTLHEALLYTP